MVESQTVISDSKTSEEISKLKRKINLQIDKILEQEDQLKQASKREKQYEAELLELKKQGSKVVIGGNNSINNFINSFCNIITNILKNNELIPYKNYTKNSIKYCKVEKSSFDQYIDQDNTIDKKNFINWCIDFGYIKSDESRKYVFNDNQMRIYFINKRIIEILSGEE